MLTLLDEQIAVHHAAGLNAAEVAAKLRQSVHAVYAALRNPYVRARVLEITSREYADVYAMTRASIKKTVEKLEEIRDGEFYNASVRLAAMRDLVNLNEKLAKHVDVLPRMAAFEASLNPALSERRAVPSVSEDTVIEPRGVPAGFVADDDEV